MRGCRFAFLPVVAAAAAALVLQPEAVGVREGLDVGLSALRRECRAARLEHSMSDTAEALQAKLQAHQRRARSHSAAGDREARHAAPEQHQRGPRGPWNVEALRAPSEPSAEARHAAPGHQQRDLPRVTGYVAMNFVHHLFIT